MSKAPIVADLHVHTRHSDGELTAEAVVALAVERGIEVIGLADHDTVAGVAEAQRYGQTRGVEVIAGCELTIYEGESEMHLLAYFVDLSTETPFARLLAKLRESRHARALKSAAQLRANGVQIDDADVLEAAAGAESLGRPHIAKALLKRGQVPSVNVAFDTLLSRGKPGYVSKYSLRPEEAFEAIHASGGLALLAHPGALPHDELIAPFFRRGLDGLEVNHPAHSEMNRRFYAGLARRYEKVISGGSDFHGPVVKPSVQIGCAGVDRATLSALRREAQRRKANP